MDKNRNEDSRIEELLALREITASMLTLDLDEILKKILEGVTRVLGFDRTRLYLLNGKTKKLDCIMAEGLQKERIQGVHLPLDTANSMVARAVIEKKPFIVKDALKDERVNPGLKELLGLKSFAVVPLVGRDKVIGAITADNLESEKEITKGRFDSLVAFASQAGLALENAKTYEELRDLSRTLELRVKKAAAELKKAQNKLIETEKAAALGKLSAGIAHEVRNPLTSIKILTHSLSERIKHDKQARSDLMIIETEIERVNQLIERSLQFARPKKPVFRNVKVSELVRGVARLMEGEAAEKRIELVIESKQEHEIKGDREQLIQVLINLFRNAFQSMPKGGAIHIKTTGSRGIVRIAVADEGTGIPARARRKLFEPFFTTREEGIGLGLAVVKRIIEEHNGIIRVEGNANKGTVFIMELPEKKKR